MLAPYMYMYMYVYVCIDRGCEKPLEVISKQSLPYVLSFSFLLSLTSFFSPLIFQSYFSYVILLSIPFHSFSSILNLN